MALVAGTRLGEYELLQPLGAGGMGEVWLARDTHLGRKVALKFLPLELTSDPHRVSRFEQEARAASMLNHPNVCHIYALGHTEDSQHYIAMELVEGQTLRARLRDTPLSVTEALDIAIQIARAVAAAHAAGIVHRDLKPENLMIRPDGVVKVLDFGLAKLSVTTSGASDEPTQTAQHTEPGTVLGTVAYMSPEQARGESVDLRTDVWSLGVILFELVVGRAPFTGQSKTDILVAILGQEPAFARKGQDVPVDFQRIIGKALNKDRGVRYQAMSDLAVDIEALRHELGVESGPGPQVRSPRWATAYLLRLFALALLVGAGGVIWSNLPVRLAREIPDARAIAKSVAVLPFTNLSTEGGQQYFTIGLAEELVNSLSRIPELRVVAYKVRRDVDARTLDVRGIAEQLHVGTTLQGSVTKAGARLRIRVQLVTEPTGETIWAESYDRTLNDIFAVQDEIARSVAAALQVRLFANASKPVPANPQAYNLVLEAQYLRSGGTPEDLQRAAELLHRAASIDPRNGRVFAELSRLHLTQGEDGESWKTANRAVELDPNLADAHQALGYFDMVKNWDWLAADRSFKKALALEPRNVRALRSAAALATTLGHFDEALALSKQAQEIEPVNASIYFNLALLNRKAGDLDAALINGRRAVELAPHLSAAHFHLGTTYLLRGNTEDALREFQKEEDDTSRTRGLALAYFTLGRRKTSERYLQQLIVAHRDDNPREIAQVYAWRGEKDKAFEWLDRAFAMRDIGLAELKGDPLFKNLQNDPRWEQFLTQRLKLPN